MTPIGFPFGEADAATPPLDSAISQACEAVSHNLNGQKLGRKGRFTRERIIWAAIDLLEGEGDEPFTLSAVARKADLRMSSLYNYFNDLSELMLAVLEPVMASADAIYMDRIREFWPDENLPRECAQFWSAYCDFWIRHAPLLHQRNRMSDAGDERMLRHRFDAAQPLLRCIYSQLGLGDGSSPTSEMRAMGAVLITGIERTMTVQTHPNYWRISSRFDEGSVDLAQPGARLLELAIRDSRQRLRSQRN